MGKLVKRPDALSAMASRLQTDPNILKQTLMKSAFIDCKSEEDFMAMLIVANTYQLNPLLKEIYAFRSSKGAIIPVVPVDGWIAMGLRNPNYDGVKLTENFSDDGKFESVTCEVYTKNQKFPIVITEYLSECAKDTDTWRKWPKRMLRHKALIQGYRIAFGLSGIYEEDERDRIIDVEAVSNIKPIVEAPKELQTTPVVVRGEATATVVEGQTEPPSNLITREQRVELTALAKNSKISKEKLEGFIFDNFSKVKLEDLTQDELRGVCEWMVERAKTNR